LPLGTYFPHMKAASVKLVWIGTLIFSAGAGIWAQPAARPPLVPPITPDSSPEDIQKTAAITRAGRKLTPKTWPNGARVAVAFTFDVDNESLFRTRPLPVPMSQGEYGATTGLPRILELLDRQRVAASFFIPAMSLMLHPEMLQEIRKSGRHEIGVHGWVHESLTSVGGPQEEARLLNQSIDYLTRALGQRPAGYRAPSWIWTPDTPSLVAKAGFLYDSSLMAMDQPYEVRANGKSTGLIELPISWIVDDFPYYGENGDGSLPSPDAVFQIYKGEFDTAYREKTLFVLTNHPHISGHGSRAEQLDKLITYIKTKPGVWFATLEQIAKYIKEQNPATE
jgi:peptidoglycan/xylan/chitin deacetylase (PgdA/CDA1 family)